MANIRTEVSSATLKLTFLVLLSAIFHFNTFSQFDTEFYMSPLYEIGAPRNTPSELFITTPSLTAVDVHIETGDNGATFSFDGTVTAGSPLVVTLSPELGQSNTWNAIQNNAGLIITSSQLVQCVHRVYSAQNQTITTLKGKNAIGTDFFAGSQVRNISSTYDPDEAHFISFMALEDDTEVDIVTPHGMFQAGNGPYSITLDQYETYLMRTDGPEDTVCGAHISSNKPITVISGAIHVRIFGPGNPSAAEGGVDQMVPVNLLGNEYLLARGNNDVGFDYAIILATEDDTEVFENGTTTVIATLDEGEYIDINVPGSLGDGYYLQTSKNAYCFHISGASESDEVSMAVMPQINCTGSSFVEFTGFGSTDAIKYFNVLAEESALDDLTINGLELSDLTGIIENTVTGLPGWEVITIPADVNETVQFRSSEFFHVAYATGTGATSGFGFLSGFDDKLEFTNPLDNLPTETYSVDSICAGQTVLHCLEINSCGDDHNIIDYQGNLGEVLVAPTALPFDTCFSYTAPFNFNGNDTITFTVENRFGVQGDVDIIFNIFNPDLAPVAGENQEYCNNDLPDEIFLSATEFHPDAPIEWSVFQGSATFADANSPTTEITNVGFGQNIFILTQTLPCESQFDVVSVTIFDPNTPEAEAGPDVELCSNMNTYTMQANSPGPAGIGIWDINFGNATVQNTGSNTAQVVGIGVGTNVFEWNILNGPCNDGLVSTDSMIIRVFDENHPPAMVSEDQTFCSDDFINTLISSNEPIEPATAQWVVTQGSATLSDPFSLNPTVTNCGIGSNVIQWQISNGPCGMLTDEVEIFIYDENIAMANAGQDAAYCSDVSTHQLNASVPPSTASGIWTVTSGTGVFSDATSPTAVVSNLTLGVNTLRWSYLNGDCDTSTNFDEITVTIFDQNQTTAEAGDDQDACGDGTTIVQLSAEGPTAPATGQWSIFSGTGNFADATDPNSTVSGLSIGLNEFIWTVNNGPCDNGNPSMDTVEITLFDEEGQAAAIAGPDASFCTPTSTYTMQATAPTAPAQGVWTLEAGFGTISDINDPNAEIAGLGVGANVFKWEVQNGTCVGVENSDLITIFIFDENQQNATSGPDQEVCLNPALPLTVDLEANDQIFPATGTWTLVSGAGTFADANDPNTTVSGLIVGTNIVRWTINNGPCTGASFAETTITVYDVFQVAANAGGDQSVCNDDLPATLDANIASFPAQGTWSVVSGQGTFANENSPTTTVSGLSIGENIFSWSIDNGACEAAPTTDLVSVFVFDNAAPAAAVGPNVEICSNEEPVTITGNMPIAPGTGIWSLVSGTGTIADNTSPTTTVSNLSLGNNVFRWTLDNGPCDGAANSFAQITVTVFDEDLVPANAGMDIAQCSDGGNELNLSATGVNAPATGEWTLESGTGTIVNPGLPNTLVTGLGLGENVFRWTVNNGACQPSTTVDFVTVTLYDSATATANAGADQEICAPLSQVTMGATPAPSPAQGEWTLVSGSGTITSPNNPNSTITDLQVGSNIFEWTVQNGPCTGFPASDTVTIFVFDDTQATATAGEDQVFCSPVSSTQLAGNPITAPASGTWTLVSGSGTILAPNNPTSSVNGLQIGENIFQWTVDNGACEATTSSDQVSIFIYDDNAPDAVAGIDIDICSNEAAVMLNANGAVGPAVGEWTLVSGSGNFTDPNSPTTTVTNYSVGTNVYEWTIDNGPCAGGTTSDQVALNVYFENQAMANAGADQDICTPETSAVLTANTPTAPATGQWTVNFGSGIFADATDPNTTVTGLGTGPNIFTWTIDNGLCLMGSSNDLVTITLFDGGAPPAEAGEDQEICSPASTATMTAEAAVFPGEGTWTLFQGTGNIAEANNPTTAITGLTIGVNRFVWSLDYATCGSGVGNANDTINLIVYDSSVLMAEAGNDETYCSGDDLSNITLNATAVDGPGNGTWTLLSGAGVVLEPTNPSSQVTNLGIGVNVFEWTIYNGPCLSGAALTDQMTINIFDDNQMAAAAGDDIEICAPAGLNVDTQLSGNPATAPAVGTWTLQTGGGTITDPNDPNTTVTNVPVGNNVFVWTIDNGTCGNETTTDAVSVLVYDENQAIADAGDNQEFCTPTSTATLAANAIAAPATGTWTLLSGSGTIANDNDPNTGLTGLVVGENVFRWSVDNGPCGVPTTDVVSIFIFDENAPIAAAGEDQSFCSNEATSTNLEANTPLFPATGIWTLLAGTGDLSNPSDPEALVSNLGVGENQFIWTISNGPCTDAITQDTVSVFIFDENAALAATGGDLNFCSTATEINLNAVVPDEPATGAWMLLSGTGDITDPTSPTSGVTNMLPGINVFEWTVTNGACANSTSTAQTTVFLFDENQEIANAGNDQGICSPQTSTNLAGNALISPAAGTWTVLSGTGVLADANDPNSFVTDLSLGPNGFIWTIDNGPCAGGISMDTVIVTVFNQDATFADAGEDLELCAPESTATLTGNMPSATQTGEWALVSGVGDITTPASNTTEITGLEIGVNIFTWTIDNGACGLSQDTVLISVFDPDEEVSNPGPSAQYCTPTSTHTMAANQPNSPAFGTWILIAGEGTISDVNDPNAEISGLTIGENIFLWQVYNGPCADPSIGQLSIFIFDENAEDADGGEDVEVCNTTEANLNAVPSVFPALGIWTSLDGPGTITNVNDPNALITDLEPGVSTFIWTVDNSPCANGLSQDTVSIFVFEEEATMAQAGDDIELCTPQSVVNLNAAPIEPQQTGTWTITSGLGSINDPNNPMAEVSALPVGTTTLQWSVYNGPCVNGSSQDEVTINVYDENHPPAFAGPDQDLCLPANATGLQAQLAVAPAVGSWSLVQGAGNIISPTNPLTAVNDLGVGTNIFVWSIYNGPCAETNVLTDTVEIRLYDPLLVLADAGEDVEVCTPENSIVLAASTPNDPAIGTWSILSGVGGSFADVNDPNTTINALVVGEIELLWTVNGGPCDNAAQDTVRVSLFDDSAPLASAGEDQEFCDPVASTNLAALIPTAPSTGTWTLLSGTAAITDPSDPNTELTNLSIGVNTLKWEVYNGPCLGFSSDTVLVSIFDPNTPDANAGPDLSFCSPFQNFQLAGSPLTPPATGMWSVASGSATIDNPTASNATVSALGFDNNILVWSVDNGACGEGITPDTLIVSLFSSEVGDANAGPDVSFCGEVDSLQMNGSVIVGNAGTGTWTILDGGGTFANVNNEASYLYNIPIGNNVYEWEVDNGICGITKDTILISVFDPELPPADAGPDLDICSRDFLPFELEGSEVELPATGFWTVLGESPAVLDDPLLFDAEVQSLGNLSQDFQSIDNYLTWTVDNGACGTTVDSLYIEFRDCYTIEVPNAFSPNGDGINDFIVIRNLDNYPGHDLKIFNRWGTQIYGAAPYENDWDGTSNHSGTIGDILPVSTYYYILDLGNGNEVLNGYIYLRR